MKVVESVVMNSLFCIILIVATISNSLLLIVFQRRPGLRTISNRFVINLLVTNLVTCWSLIPLLLSDNMWRETRWIERGFLKHESLCPIKEGLSVGLCTANVFSVLIIAIDQYFAVLDPLRYHALINSASSLLMIVVCWLISIAFSLAGGLAISSNESSWYFCDSGGSASSHAGKPFQLLPEPYQIAFPVAFAFLVFTVPFTSICWIYISIYTAAHQNSQRTRRNGSSAGFSSDLPTNDYIVVSSPAFVDRPAAPLLLHHSSTKGSLRSTSSSIVNSVRRRISNTSMFKYREETRAARISALVIVMALFCWFPFTLLLVLRSPIFDSGLSYYVKQIGVLSLTFSAIASPLIFAHRNRRVHKELCRLFRRSKRTYSFYDRCPASKLTKAPQPLVRDAIVKGAAAAAAASHRTFDLLSTLSDDGSAKSPQVRSTLKQSSKKPAILTYFPRSARTVSILNKVWITIDKSEQKGSQSDCESPPIITLPEVALDVETSRSSFSSNSSATSSICTQSTHRSTSAASFSDIIAVTVDENATPSLDL